MSQTAIKITVGAVLAHRLHRAALAKGTSVADICRRACEAHVDMPASVPDDVLIEKHETKRGKVVGAFLNGNLASAVARFAAESGNSQSWALRLLVREGLRARGAAPTPDATVDAQ